MGDRRNVVIKQGVEGKNGAVTFYTHWQGWCLENIVRDALKRGQSRWGDDGYLARIIFSEMIQREVLDETGYGIHAGERRDEEYPNIIVHTTDRLVTIAGEGFSFDEFIKRADTEE